MALTFPALGGQSISPALSVSETDAFQKQLADKYGPPPPKVVAPQNTQASVDSSLPSESSIAQKLNPVQNVGVGIVKGGLSTLRGAGELGTNIAQALLPKAMEPKGADIYNPETELGATVKERLKPASTGQSIGYGLEKVAEFLIPAGAASKAERSIDLMSKGISSPLGAATARIVGKGLVQGLSAGGVNLVQTGGDLEEAGKTAALAGGTRAGMAVIGEGARALHIPEKLYTTFFKNSWRDMQSKLTTEGYASLQKTDPEKFNRFVESGIIHVDDAGQIKIDESLAKQALDKGLRGSPEKMAETVVHGALDSEHEARTIVQNAPPIQLSQSEATSIRNVLNDIAESNKDVAFGRVSNEAKRLADAIPENLGAPTRIPAVETQATMDSLLPSKNLTSKYPGATDLRYPNKAKDIPVDARTILDIRRFFDARRIESSFNAPAAKQSLGQQNFKAVADRLRGKLSELDGMKEVMSNYQFNIEALESIAKEAARRGNNQIIGLIDSNFLAGGLAGEHLGDAGIAAFLRRYLLSARGTTGLGQAIQNPSIGTGMSTALEAGASGLADATTQ